MKGTEPALGKCATCGDQLLSIPGRTPDDSRRIICPVCVTNALEDARERLRYVPSPDEEARMSE